MMQNISLKNDKTKSAPAKKKKKKRQKNSKPKTKLELVINEEQQILKQQVYINLVIFRLFLKI